MSGRAKTGLLANCVVFAVSQEFLAPASVIDNTDLARIAAAMMDVALNKITNKLYVGLEEAGVAAPRRQQQRVEEWKQESPFR